MRRKRRKRNDKGGAPAWMVTYGDMMSLLLTFFVLLVSMSSIHESKFRKALGSLLGAFGVLRFDSAAIKLDELPSPEKYEREVARIREEFDVFKDFIEEWELEEAVEVMETEEGMLVRMANPVMFGTGEADLKQEAFEVLDTLVNVLLKTDAEIRIEGHTDNVPISNERFPSNWELSAARAINVLRFFNERGIPGEKLTAVGLGEYRPLVDNKTPENRKQNRRVEIYIDYKEKLEKRAVRSQFKKEDSDG